MIEVISCAPNPHIGESKTLSYLQQHLGGGDHVILTNYYLPDQSSTLEIDLVVINRWGIFLLEVKDWYGKIVADQRFWHQEGRRPVASPISSIDRKCKVMHSYLGYRRDISNVGLVVLSSDSSRLEIDDERANRVVMLERNLITALTSERLHYHPFRNHQFPSLTTNDIRGFRDRLVRNQVNPSRQLIGQYRVTREIQRSDDLTESEAEHTLIPGRKARIKTYRMANVVSRQQLAEDMRRFRRDIEALWTLGPHPSLIAAYEFLKDDNSDEYYYLIVESVKGQTLRAVIEDAQSPPLSMQIAWVREIAEALRHCHSRNVVHRNLTPDNIYLSDEGQIKVGNFDFARASALGGTISVTGQPLVQTRYTAPEQISKPHEVDGRADIYGLGVIWYDLLRGSVGDTPITADSLVDLRLPGSVALVLGKMLAPRRQARYISADALITDLEALT